MSKKESIAEKVRRLELENAELRGENKGLKQVVDAVKSAPQPIVLAHAISYPVPYVRPVYPQYVPFWTTTAGNFEVTSITTNGLPDNVQTTGCATNTLTTWGN